MIQLSAARRMACAPVVCLLASTLISGCGLESPEVPTFETALFVPIGEKTYTVGELIESEESLEGDTTGTHPVYLAFDGRIDSIHVGDRLSADIVPLSLSAEVGELPLEVETVAEAKLSVEEISPIEVPEDGIWILVEPFQIDPIEQDLAPFPEFDEGTIQSGTVDITITNELPISIEGIVIRIDDRAFGREVITFGIPERLEPGTGIDRSLDISGKTISNQLAITLLSGSSPGSDGLVFVEPDDHLLLRGWLQNLRFQSLKGPIPPQTYERSDSTEIDAQIRILEASIQQTSIPVRLESRIGVPVSVVLILPDLMLDSQQWSRTYEMGVGSIDDPFVVTAEELLDGNSISFPEARAQQQLRYVLRAEYAGSRGESVELAAEMGVTADVGAFHLRLGELTGVVDPQVLEIDATSTEISFPDEIEGIEFQEAELTLRIENEVQIPGKLTLSAIANGSDGSADLQLEGEISAASPTGSTLTTLVWDENNSNILDLVNVRPNEIIASGSIQIGDSTLISTISGDDTIDGRYTIRTPARVRIGDASYDPDPFSIEVNEETRQRILDDLLDAEATLRVHNHLPTGITVTLQFADDSTSVYRHPAIVLDPLYVPGGVLDAETGRVAEERLSELTIELTDEQVDFFAREDVWVGSAIVLESTGDRSIELMTTDRIQIEGLLRFGIEVSGK